MYFSQCSIAYLFLWGLSALIISIGTWLLYRHYKFKWSAQRVQGKTIDPLTSSTAEDTLYETRFEYFVKGTRYENIGNTISNSRRGHRQGRTVDVYFLPNSPANGKLLDWWEPLTYATVIGVGCFIIFVALYGTPSASMQCT